MSVSGLLVPSNTVQSRVVLATITWDPYLFEIVASKEFLTVDNVKARLRTVIADQYHNVCGGEAATNVTKYFTTMLEQSDLEKHLNTQFSSLYFMPSLYSIIFASADKVYKAPLVAHNLEEFFRLIPADKNAVEGIKRTLFPLSSVFKFFSFPLLDGPLSVSEIQQCYFNFSQSVYEAIEELVQYAHLDIRTPFKRSEGSSSPYMAVLIDVDHAGRRLPVNFNSVMYDICFDSVGQYDWRQFAIMLARILDDNMENYHEEEPSFPEGEFGDTLRSAFDNGEPPDITKYVPLNSELSLEEVLNSCNE